ncbi:MAG: VanZ family protein [Gemmatimonadota bacterium]
MAGSSANRHGRQRAQDAFAAQLARTRIAARGLYVGIILLATLSSLRPDLDGVAIAERLGRMLRPSVSGRDLIDGARNVALFAGWGLLWMITAGPGRSWRALRHAVLTGAALSLAVEGLQLLSDTRISSVLDLITNTGGAFAGALAAVFIVMSLAKATGARSFVGIPASVFAVSYGVAVSAESFVPLFRQESQVHVSGGVLERLAMALEALRWGTVFEPPLGDFLLFLPAGAFAVAWLYEMGRDYGAAAWIVACGAALILPAAEVAHGAIGIEIHAGAALTHVIAVAIGAWLGAKSLPRFTRAARGADRPRILTLAYATLLLLWAARPYRTEPAFGAMVAKLRSEWWIPLRSLGARMDLFSVVDVCGPFLLYMPLGALLAVWPLRRRGLLSGMAPAIYLACATELGQILIATRTLDITDLLIQATGAAIGWLAVRRAGFRPYGVQLAPSRLQQPNP